MWNPDQPRVPAGRIGGGPWTDGGNGGGAEMSNGGQARTTGLRLADASNTPSPEFRAELKRRIDAADEHLADAYARASSGLEISHAEIDRARLAIAEKALGAVGSSGWDKDRTVANFPAGSYKCNLFVFDVLKGVEADPPLANGGVLYNWFGYGVPRYPVLAGQWGNPAFRIDGWDIVEGSPAIGDIIAAPRWGPNSTGHVAIFVGHDHGAPMSVSAMDHFVEYESWPFKDSGRLFRVRRYRGVRAP